MVICRSPALITIDNRIWVGCHTTMKERTHIDTHRQLQRQLGLYFQQVLIDTYSIKTAKSLDNICIYTLLCLPVVIKHKHTSCILLIRV